MRRQMLIDAAVRDTLQAIRDDRTKAPKKVKRLLEYIGATARTAGSEPDRASQAVEPQARGRPP